MLNNAFVDILMRQNAFVNRKRQNNLYKRIKNAKIDVWK